MLIENDPDVLFQCDLCYNTISPNAALIVDNGKHFCSTECYDQRNQVVEKYQPLVSVWKSAIKWFHSAKQ